MIEAVRLVVWDMDETFWKGTLTEGGIQYLDRHHDIVIELARRGIMSSICSRNEFEAVKKILEEKGLWDYFVFPSINWESKGPRLAKLVEAIQLRPPTILFVDDNPMNRHEALHFAPGIQVADERAIAGFLDDPLFVGKDDKSLTRLAQYKLLEARAKDVADYSENGEFLRASDIRVTVENDVESHLDRAIELINRTNQLNFTKRRLSEDLETARRDLGTLLTEYNVQAGLVGVRDRYGDYGHVGVYVLRNDGSAADLIHYCFSCRILGMGIETWLYHRLGRPGIGIAGAVLTDILSDEVPDWIGTGSGIEDRTLPASPRRVFVRGGCDLAPVAHYLGLSAAEVVAEFNFARNGIPIRIDHSGFLRAAMDGASSSERKLEAAAALGYEPGDFPSAVVASPDKFDAYVFSFWTDITVATYEHRESGLRIPFIVPPGDMAGVDVRQWEENEILLNVPDPQIRSKVRPAIEALKRFYEFHDPSPELFKETLVMLFDLIPPTATVIILLTAESVPHSVEQPYYFGHFKPFNRAIIDLAASRPNVHLLRITDFVKQREEMENPFHFRRMVYFRLYQAIEAILTRDPESCLSARIAINA